MAVKGLEVFHKPGLQHQLNRTGQDAGSAGKITNCQIGVFATYASRHGHAFIDRRLYLPKAWTDNAPWMAAAMPHCSKSARMAQEP